MKTHAVCRRFSWATLIVGCFALAHCGSFKAPGEVVRKDNFRVESTASLAFETIAQGAAPGGEGAAPVLYLVTTDLQRAALAPLLDAAGRQALASVKLSSDLVIAVFAGLKPTSGYRIAITSVAADHKSLEVKVELSSPTPGEPVRQGFESPYHLVRLSRDRFNLQHPGAYRLHDASGRTLQQGQIASEK